MQKGTFDEAEASFRSQIKVLEEDLARQKVSTPILSAFVVFAPLNMKNSV